MDFYSSDSFSQSEEYTNTHTHILSLKQDLETSGQLSSQELSDTIETWMHTKTLIHTNSHKHTPKTVTFSD